MDPARLTLPYRDNRPNIPCNHCNPPLPYRFSYIICHLSAQISPSFAPYHLFPFCFWLHINQTIVVLILWRFLAFSKFSSRCFTIFAPSFHIIQTNILLNNCLYQPCLSHCFNDIWLSLCLSDQLFIFFFIILHSIFFTTVKNPFKQKKKCSKLSLPQDFETLLNI